MANEHTRIAVCSWSLQAEDADHLIALAHQADVTALSLALSPLVHQPKLWGGCLDAVRDAGLEIVSGMMAMHGEDYSTLERIAVTGGVRPESTWPANEAHARDIAACASDAGITLVTFHAGFLPEHDGPERQRIIQRLQFIAGIFADHGVAIALETGQESADTLLDVLAQLDRPNVGVNFDPANMILYGTGDPVDALSRLLPHVSQVHIKDAIASETAGQWGTEVPVGEGAVDWQGFFDVLIAANSPVDMVIEREAGEHRVADVQTALQLLDSHFLAR